MTQKPQKSASDLGVRTLSALAMLVVAGLALWCGKTIFGGFVLLLMIGMLWELRGMTRALPVSLIGQLAVYILGSLYIGVAALTLITLRSDDNGLLTTLGLMMMVWATDIGAYFSGRAIGGPKIAPAISPSKTWAGLIGGMIAAGLVATAMSRLALHQSATPVLASMLLGALVAVIAQIGDFLESFLKRLSGKKDSSNLIPGHGGLLDRLDGVLAVAFAVYCYQHLAGLS